MMPKLFTFLQRHRRLLAIIPTIAIGVSTSHWLGLFQTPEWRIRDTWFRLRSAPEAAAEIVIVTIDEQDIASVNSWPIPDWALADLLDQIRQQQPRAIGLDLYRDLPVGTGHDRLKRIFQTTPNLIGVEKLQGDRVKPPPELAKRDQVGVADLVLDGDRHVRRALLTMGDEHNPEIVRAGLATQVALKYLAGEKIELLPIDAESQTYRLGQAIFQPLEAGEAGYRDEDMGGYQILLNWHGSEQGFTTVSMRDVLAGKVPSGLMRDRMVFIGSNAISTNDFFATPFSSSWLSTKRPTPGVVIHANIAQQLVNAAKRGQRNLQGFRTAPLRSGLWAGQWQQWH